MKGRCEASVYLDRCDRELWINYIRKLAETLDEFTVALHVGPGHRVATSCRKVHAHRHSFRKGSGLGSHIVPADLCWEARNSKACKLAKTCSQVVLGFLATL